MVPFTTPIRSDSPRECVHNARLLMGFAVSVLLMAATASASEVGSAPNFCAPALTTSSLTAPKIGEARCDQPDCARRHLDARASVRLTGEFGMFTGRVARWSADSLTGFSADPDWGGVPPPAPLGWVQVQRVDQRVSNTATGAVIGALTLGALGALVAVTGETSTAAFTVFSGKQPDYGQAALKGGAIGALIGAALGAAMGSTSNRWVPIYQRP